MSTFSGLVLGVVTAAVVTVFYGEQLSSGIRGLLDLRSGFERTVLNGARGDPQESVPLPDPAEEPAAVAEVPQPLPVPEPDNAAPPIERYWADYRAAAEELQPVGHFPHRRCFTRAAAAHSVPESLLLAVASGESNFDLAARSPRDAIGLMQIRWPQTSRHLGVTREADLYDPCTNVDAGARYLAELIANYDGNLHRALAAYNYGPSRIASGPMPDGATWYSQYIYQHLQRVLGRPHVASSELIEDDPAGESGYQVLMTFNASYRARAFLHFVSQMVPPGLELAQRSESLGRHEVVLLYSDREEKQRALQLIRDTGLLALATDT